MIEVTVKLTSLSEYSSTRFIEVPRKDNETNRDWEFRIHKEKMHYNEKREVIIPPMAFKNCLSEAAKFLSLSVPGKGMAKFTKHFESGILIVDPLNTGVPLAQTEAKFLFLPADGKRGGGKRVMKCVPILPKWSGDLKLVVIDPAITKEVFAKHLEAAGMFIGVGFFRPSRNGYYGRFTFKAEELKWTSK